MRLPRLNHSLSRRQTITLLTVVVLGLIIAPSVYAQNALANSIFLILDNILMGMITLFASMTGIFVSLLVLVARYNVFLNAPIVQQGWPIVRDLMNMVFIIGLLMISAGTVLRLQNYRYNRLLGKLIIMAFLVNFSKFIAVFLLQFGQIVMLTFVNAFRDVAFGNFSHMFGLDAVLNFARENTDTLAKSYSGLSIFVTLLAGLIMMMIAFVVMLAITVILFVRIVALWLLIILSPLAYALRVLPQTEQYATQWWREFGKYVVVGPVLAFFLWIALALVGSGNCASTDINVQCTGNPISQADQKTKDAQTDAEKDTASLRKDFVSEALSLDRMMTFVVGIIFLMMGLNYAQKSGTAGASFAGKVASAGFSGAATVTGLNYVRDRAVAPVQGWIQNRQRARQSAIQQRTETLEAAGDRARAAAPVVPVILSRGGQRRAEAAANAFERNRTARTGQQLGVKDWSDEQVQREFLTSGNMRNRIMAMEELRSRGGGRLNLADAPMRDAFNAVTSASRAPFSGVNAYMPEADRKKLRESVLNENLTHMDPAQVRTLMPTLTSAEEQAMAVNALEKKDALRADSPADVAMVNGLRAGLRDIPVKLKEFDDALKKSNPRMALQTVYNNFAAGAADVQHLLSDANQGLFDMANLRTRDYAAMVEGMHRTGMSRNDAQAEISNTVLTNARSKKELDAVVDAMTYDVRNLVFGGKAVNLPDVAGRRNERRDWLAAKGFAGEAFKGLANEDAVMREFVRGNETLVAKHAREGSISRMTVDQSTAMQEMMDSQKIGRKVLKEMIDNNPALKEVARNSAAKVAYATNSAVDAAGMPIALADSSAQGIKENNRREIVLELAQGGKVLNPVTGTEDSALRVAYQSMPLPEQANARNARRNAIQKTGESFIRLDMSDPSLNDEAKRDVIINITPTALSKISEKHPDLARKLADEKRQVVNDINSGKFPSSGLYMGEMLELAEAKMLDRHAKTLNNRNDRGF